MEQENYFQVYVMATTLPFVQYKLPSKLQQNFQFSKTINQISKIVKHPKQMGDRNME